MVGWSSRPAMHKVEDLSLRQPRSSEAARWVVPGKLAALGGSRHAPQIRWMCGCAPL